MYRKFKRHFRAAPLATRLRRRLPLAHGWCWTGAAACGRVEPLGCPGRTAGWERTRAPERFANLGNVPTVAEAGVPGYALDPWLGLFVPAKVPQDVLARIHAEVVKILGGAELKTRLAPQGIELATSSPADFARFIRDDNAKWGKIIKEAGIKGD